MVDPLDSKAIIQRLEALEHQNRRLKRACIVTAIVIGAILLMGQTRSSRVLEAEKFVLKDAAGLVRGQISSFEGNALLTLYGPQGAKVRGAMAEIGAGPTGPFILLTDEEMNVVDLSSHNGVSNLKVVDKNGNKLMMLAGGSGGGSLAFLTPDQKLEAAISASPSGSSVLVSGDHSLVVLDGNSLAINDTEGFSAQLGQTQLVTTSTGEKHTTSAASIVLFGKEHKVIWSAP